MKIPSYTLYSRTIYWCTCIRISGQDSISNVLPSSCIHLQQIKPHLTIWMFSTVPQRSMMQRNKQNICTFVDVVEKYQHTLRCNIKQESGPTIQVPFPNWPWRRPGAWGFIVPTWAILSSSLSYKWNCTIHSQYNLYHYSQLSHTGINVRHNLQRVDFFKFFNLYANIYGPQSSHNAFLSFSVSCLNLKLLSRQYIILHSRMFFRWCHFCVSCVIGVSDCPIHQTEP